MRSIPAVTACVLVCFTLAGCTSDPTAAPSAPTNSTSPAGQLSTATSAATASPSATDLVPGALKVTKPEGWRDTSVAGMLHYLAPNVSTNPTAERWGDILIYEATSAFDPSTRQQVPLPADPAAWLRANPAVEVLAERTVQVDGRSAALIDTGRSEDGWAFKAGEDVIESSAGGHERFIFVPVGQRWVVVQASTFRGPAGLAEPDEPSDALAVVLESMDLPE
jgi:hypothetical protein